MRLRKVFKDLAETNPFCREREEKEQMNYKQVETLLKSESQAQAGGVISLVIGTFAVMFIAAVLIAPLATTITNAKNGGSLSSSENQTKYYNANEFINVL